jgi:hypothetical protein
MNDAAASTAVGKPVPRAPQYQGQKAELPMHMTRAPVRVARVLPSQRTTDAAAKDAHTGVERQLLTASPPRMQSSAADTRTPPTRTGADACLGLPSRYGDRLHYRNGLVTDMDGRHV